MSFSVAETIKKIGVEKLVVATGIPRRTLYRWQKDDKIPGEGVARDWRLNQLKEAIDKLEAQKKPAKAKRARAAA